MSENSIAMQAVDSAVRGGDVYCKFLSANDSGETGGHQSGILISKTAIFINFTENLFVLVDVKVIFRPFFGFHLP